MLVEIVEVTRAPPPTSRAPPGHVAVARAVVCGTPGPGTVVRTTSVCAGPPVAHIAYAVIVSSASLWPAKPVMPVHADGSAAASAETAPAPSLGAEPFTTNPLIGW